MDVFSLKKNSSGKYYILGPDRRIIKSHTGKRFIALSYNVAKHICDDLNFIQKRNQNESNEFKKALKAKNKKWLNLYPCELRESLAYCLISTMQNIKRDHKFNYQLGVQNDLIFRMQPLYKNSKNENEIIDKMRSLFGIKEVKWKKNNITFIREEIYKEFSIILNSFSNAEMAILLLVYKYLDSFSATLPLFWVSGKINEDYLVNAYWVFNKGVHPDRLNKLDYEEVAYIKNRFLFLKIIKWAYQWGEESLP